MKQFPHKYVASVTALPEHHINVQADGLPTFQAAPPEQFGGPGDHWSPEDLLMASVSSCLVLTFRAIAQMSKFEWLELECASTGTLDRIDGTTAFTEIHTKARLTVPPDANVEKARQLIMKAEEACLITNSISASSHCECEVVVKD